MLGGSCAADHVPAPVIETEFSAIGGSGTILSVL